MNYKIQIKTVQVEAKTGTSKKGKPYSFRCQTGYVELPNEPFPVKIKFNLADEQEPLQVGFGELVLDQSIYIDGYDQMQIRPVVRQLASVK